MSSISSFVYELSLGIVIFSIVTCLVRLSLLDWYEREEKAGDTLKISMIVGVLVAALFAALMSSVSDLVMVRIYQNLTLASFILSLIILYPFISWMRKKIYSHFYVAVYLAYDIVLWYIFPLFFYYIMGLNIVQTMMANYVTGAVLSTLLATAIMKEMRAKEVILGGLSAVTTAIAIADFSARIFSMITIGPTPISVIHIFLVVAFIVQYIYYKRVVE